MYRYHRAATVFLVAVFGLWGCSKAPINSVADSGSAEKLKTVESKLTKLEDEFRIANSTRDQLRKKLYEAEETQKQQQAQLDSLKESLKAKDEAISKRTTERDQLNNQYEAFRKNVKDLLFKAEEALGKPAEGSPTVPAIPTSNKKPDEVAVPAVPPTPALPELPVPTPK
jgi:septal ring factor EnvC (AmiA/AmiB activator)